MTEVHRYKVVRMLSEGGNRISYDPHGPEVVMAEAYDQLKAELAGLRTGYDAQNEVIAGLRAENERLDRLIVANKQISDTFKHERDTLGQAIGEAVTKVGIAAPGFPLTGPHLLMFLEDMANDLVRTSAEAEALRKDAERYRWLRRGENYAHQYLVDLGMENLEGFDRSIDAAMAKEANHG